MVEKSLSEPSNSKSDGLFGSYMQSEFLIKDFWLRCTEKLKTKLDATAYSLWIADIVPVELNDKTLVLGVSNRVFTDWLVENYGQEICQCVTEEYGRHLKIKFEKGHEPAVLPVEESHSSPPAEVNLLPAPLPAAVLPSENRFNRHYTFDSFVVGGSNHFAYAACQAVSAAPGAVHNPLFIYSPTGLGKSHLLQAIGQRVLRHNPKTKVEYIISEEFGNKFIDSLQKRKTLAFNSYFRNVDVLLIDDVHFFAGKDTLQEAFFHTFNALYNGNKQIVLTSDRNPNEINGLEKRLVSRFEWGLTVDIQPPELETRIAILKQKQQEHCNAPFSDEVLFHLAAKIKSNIRRLEGALLKLIFYLQTTNCPPRRINVELADSLLEAVFAEESCLSLSVESIQKVVADYYDIRLADMVSKRRPANIDFPRQVAMYFARKLTGQSFASIAEQFKKNHATVLHAVNSIEDKIKSSPELKLELAGLERKLKQ